MDNQPTGSYEGVRPAPGRDDSRLDPFEIQFKPEFRGNRGPREPFVNAHGVVIGDHEYASPQSPLEQWSKDTDPSVMAGEQWVHPYKDIGFRTRENRDLFERGIPPRAVPFMHPSIQASAADEPDSARWNSEEPEIYDWLDPDEEYVMDEP
ncbi:DUF3905 domain-containing protein [Cohnella sp. CFH 77786]|uniref:DUF3905 domain-containing protein n=1 Tax=Cohnella sp. CFH 77786 TaxID=2662265 RepID=UPI001C60F551|nr:DUF3905 domain-containing protein [Cohnella sp. CFH 77786]MBW5445610.1 DUF3905 domain-containing protein [Cohnella sp. CFH 77786]